MQVARQEVIMNFSVPPSDEDLLVLARTAIECLPDEFQASCKDIEIEVEEFADDLLADQLDCEDLYEILLFLKSGSEISPGVESKSSDENDKLTFFRRPILDYWAEVGEDLADVIHRIVFEEIAAEHDYTSDEISDMVSIHIKSL